MAPQVDQNTLLIGKLIGGLLCGLLPLFLGLKVGKKPLAFAGLAACIASGAFFGALLALPVALVFVVLIRYVGNGNA